jgi:hypothetical protein
MNLAHAPAEQFALANQLALIGFGPARSRNLAATRQEFAQLATVFAETCKAKGCGFRVFQARGRNGYFTRLRLTVITAEDSRSHIELEVGSLSTTKGQVLAMTNAIYELEAQAAAQAAA